VSAITLDPQIYTCEEHQIDLTAQVKEALEEDEDTPLAYWRPLLGRAAPRSRPFEVIITCPGGEEHPLTCKGTYRR